MLLSGAGETNDLVADNTNSRGAMSLKTALLLGSTGETGKELLKQLVASPSYGRFVFRGLHYLKFFLLGAIFRCNRLDGCFSRNRIFTD